MNWLEARIAFRSFHSVKETSFISFTAWLTLAGIAVGVMSLIVVMSVMNGFEKELQKNIIDTQSHILLYRKDIGIENWQQIKQDIKNVDPSIREVFPLTYHEVLFIHEGRVQGGVLEGIDPPEAMISGIKMGETFSRDRCYVGKELALKLNLKPGDKLKVMLPDPLVGSRSSQSGFPKVIELKVADIFELGHYEYSSRYVYADLSFVQKTMGWENRVAAFKIRIEDPQTAMTLGRKIRRQTSFPFFMKTWMNTNQNLFLAIKIQKIIMAIILACIIGTAIFNVVSSLIMIVIQKTKEISILKALGMENFRISKIFLWQGFLMGAIGTGVGLLLAFGICALLSHFRFIRLSPEIYYLSYLPVEIRLGEVLMVSAGMLIASIFASFFPSRRAVHLFPIEGIRYE